MTNTTWAFALSADWSVAGDWNTGAVPGSGDVAFINVPGSYTLSIAAGESESVAALLQFGAMLDVKGTLTLVASGSGLVPGAVLEGGGLVAGGASLENDGLIDGNVPGSFLQIDTSVFNNTGTVLASGGGAVLLGVGNLTNLSGDGTLTGGVFEVDGPAFGAVASLLINLTGGTTPTIVTDAATLVLRGDASAIATWDSAANNYLNIEGSLTTIAAGGDLDVLDGRDWFGSTAIVDDGVLRLGGGVFSVASLTVAGLLTGYGTIEGNIGNLGTVEASGGVLRLDNAVSDTGAIRVDANAMLELQGSFARAIVDDGTIKLQGQSLKLSGAVSGGGGFVIEGGSSVMGTLELATPVSVQVAFNGAGALLLLDAPASFTGAVVGFGSGDTIELAGVTADAAVVVGGTLEVTNAGATVDSIPLVGNYGSASFAVGTGGGGASITVGGVIARDYELEGPYWHSKAITWSFAASNFAEDGNDFSHFIAAGTLPGDSRDQSAYESVISAAFARWAAIGGFNFVQVADSASVDMRVGWSDFGAGSTEIGQALFAQQSDVMLPDSLVRLGDPTAVPLINQPALIGGLQYQGTSSTLYQVALHEIGHSLGLAHSTDVTAVMYHLAEGSENQDVSASDIAGIQAIYAALACFVAGTRIATARGTVAVESLRIGDGIDGLVSGQRRFVRWVGQRRLAVGRHARPQDVQPVRVLAHAFGHGVPQRDLRLSPDHAVYAGGVLMPVRYLVNGATVVQERVRSVTYFHVELEDAAGAAVHDVIQAEGLPVESYLDTGNRAAFANGGDAVQLHPDFSRQVWTAEGCAPLTLAGPAVVAERRRLLARAPLLGHWTTQDPDLHVVVEGRVLEPVACEGRQWRFIVPPGTLRLRSRTAVPAEVAADSSDARLVGVAVAGMKLNRRGIKLHSPRLVRGFQAPETDGVVTWRWTDGDAVLRLRRGGELTVTLGFAQAYRTNATEGRRRSRG